MGAITGAIRAGRAYVEMFADPSALIRTLEAAKKRVREFGKFTAKIGATAAAAGGAVFAPIAKMFTSAVEEGADVAKLASKFGSTAEQISTLRGAFAQAGVGAGDFASAIESLGSKISHAADGNGFLIDSLQSLGTGKELMGKGLDEQLDIIAERIKAIPNAFDQMRAASELGLGSMSEALKKGKAGLDEYRAASVKNGDALSTEQAKQALEIQTEYNHVLIAVKSTLLEVGMALIPTGASFTSVGESIREGLSDVREWIKENRGIVVAVTAVAGGLLAGGIAVAAFGGTVAAIAPIIGGLITAVVAMKAVVVAIFSALISWPGLIVVAFTAGAVGVAYLVSQTEAGQAAIADLKADFAKAADFIKGSWEGITNAIKAGDWSLAFKIGVATIDVAWKELMVNLTGGWNEFKNIFVDAWEIATSTIGKLFVDLGAAILRNIMGPINKIVDGFNAVADAVGLGKISFPGFSDEDINAARDGIKKIMDEDTAASLKARALARGEDLKDAVDARDAASRALERLKAEAKEAAEKEKPGPVPAGAPAPEKKAPSFSALSESAKGTLGSSAIAQTLGYGDNVGQRQLDAQLGIRDNTAAAIKLLTDMYAKIGGTFS